MIYFQLGEKNMALIKCPECKKKISDQSDNCPKCGYPIKTLQDENSKIESNESSINIPKENKPLYKKPVLWIVFGVIVVSIIIGIILFLNRDTKPKFDKDGKPMFIEMTNEVYTNIDNYLGYHVKVKGKVFQVLGDTGTSKGVQIWLDPETSEQNMWIYYTNDVEIKKDDYIICSGYIDSNTSYSNTYGAELSAPLIISDDMQKSNYIDVMSPTISTIELSNTKAEQYKYSIEVNKVEFAEKETRIYFTATNNGKAKMYTGVGDAIILQNGKQYNAEENYDADYESIPYELHMGVSSSGIVSFPKIEQQDFQLCVEIHSDDMDEDFEKIVFNISTKNIVTNPVVEEEKTTEETKTSNNSNTSKQPQTNKKENAITVSLQLSRDYYPISRKYLWECLVNTNGFTEEEADYAVKNSGIDWKNQAVGYAKDYQDDYIEPNELKSILREEGFSNSEIEYAKNNSGINWNENAVYYAENELYNKRTRNEILNALTSRGFTKEQASYGVKNADIDWVSKAYSYVDDVLSQSNQIEHSNCYNCGDIKGVHNKCPLCGGTVSTCYSYGYTRGGTISALMNAGFTRQEAEECVSNYDDAYFYDESNFAS